MIKPFIVGYDSHPQSNLVNRQYKPADTVQWGFLVTQCGNSTVRQDDSASLPVVNGPLSPTDLFARQQQYLHAATAENTRRAYRSAVRHFEAWGGRLPTDSATLSRYLLDYAVTLSPRTLDVRVTALSQWHRYQRFPDPTQDTTVRKTLEGIRRTHGKPRRKAKALSLDHLATMLAALQSQPASLKSLRDRALLLIGFFGGFRRSELVAISITDLQWEAEGLLVHLPRSKTDQEGHGMVRAIPYGSDSVCPLRALTAWLTAADIQSGPLFRSINRWGKVQAKALDAGAVNTLLKGLAEHCGFDFAPELSSHSFRRGLSTSAAREQVDFALIKKQGGWKTDAIVWEYIDEGRQFADNAAHPLMEKIDQLLDRRR